VSDVTGRGKVGILWCGKYDITREGRIILFYTYIYNYVINKIN